MAFELPAEPPRSENSCPPGPATVWSVDAGAERGRPEDDAQQTPCPRGPARRAGADAAPTSADADERGQHGSRLGGQLGEPRLLERPPDAVWAISRRPITHAAADPARDDVFGLPTKSCAASSRGGRRGRHRRSGRYRRHRCACHRSHLDPGQCRPPQRVHLHVRRFSALDPPNERYSLRKSLFFRPNQSCQFKRCRRLERPPQLRRDVANRRSWSCRCRCRQRAGGAGREKARGGRPTIRARRRDGTFRISGGPITRRAVRCT